jgi:aminoglycoside phosphotransferase (APT) family kinase protein
MPWRAPDAQWKTMGAMIEGAPAAAGWHRSEPRRNVLPPDLDRIVAAAFPSHRLARAEPLIGGMRNANFRIWIDGMSDSFVLRRFEHDASLCRKEVDLFRHVGSAIPVPEVGYAETDAATGSEPFIVYRFVEGTSFFHLKRAAQREEIATAARAVGHTLAALSQIRFPKAGWLGPGPSATQPLLEGDNAGPCFVDLCLATPNFQARTTPQLRERIHALLWEFAAPLAALDADARLVHGDFGKGNILVRLVDGSWTVPAILDWEFALAGSPLTDVAHFLRYERRSRPLLEPHFT